LLLCCSSKLRGKSGMLKEELMTASEKCGLTDTQMRSGLTDTQMRSGLRVRCCKAAAGSCRGTSPGLHPQ